MSGHAPLLDALRGAIGETCVRIDEPTLRLGAADLWAEGPPPIAVVRPESPEAVASAIAEVTARGYSVAPRGGGLSYTGGYVCEAGRSVLFDLAGLNRINDVSEDDMLVVAEAGVTWKQLYDVLRPRGLRLPFFGTFSGAGATIGGGLSHGALFFGSARHASAAENALALEVALADGTLFRTGQWALKRRTRPAFRGFGPDLTGLFLHDGGALGIKTKVAFRLIRTPSAAGYASFAFAGFEEAARGLSAVARTGAAEDAYVLDPASVSATMAQQAGLGAASRAVRAAARSAGGAWPAMAAIASLVRRGRSAIPEGAFTLHAVAANSSQAGVAADLAILRSVAIGCGGRQIAPSIPRVARGDPFPDLNAVLGAGGRRWAALNAKVAHSEGGPMVEAHRRLVARYEEEMRAHGISVTYLLSALGTHSFSFEAVFHWNDAWLPVHRAKVDPGLLATYSEPAPDLAARAVVAALRQETVELFRDSGAASNQIGRTYPYLEALDAAPAALLRALKSTLDSKGLMNPGVLGL